MASAVLIILFTRLTRKLHLRPGYGVIHASLLALAMLPSLYFQMLLLSKAYQESTDIRVLSVIFWLFIASLPSIWQIYRAFKKP